MNLSFFRKCTLTLAALGSAAGIATAGQVLTKPIPFPSGTGLVTGWEASPPGSSGLTPLRGYRTATDGTFSYQSGRVEAPAEDSWVAKMDAFGTIAWSKSMREIVAASPYATTITFGNVGRGFTVNDLIFADGFIYVCGETRPTSGASGFGYVARISPAGGLEDFTLIEPGGDSPSARGVALSAFVRPDGIRIAVAGDFRGTSLRLQPRMGTGTAPAMEGMLGRMDSGSVRDVFAISLDTNLGGARRGHTLGFNTANEYASAVAFDGDGNMLVAMTFENPDGANSNLELNNIDDSRLMHIGNTTSQPMDESNFPGNYNFARGNWAMIVKLDGTAGRVSAHAEPIRLESGETGSNSHITGMLVDNGQLFIAGQWSGVLRPYNASTGPGYWSSLSNSNDIFVARLDISDLSWQKTVFLDSGGDDECTQLVVGVDGVYVCGSAASTLTHRSPTTSNNSTPTALTGSGTRHLFWTKLRKSELTKEWHITPYENTALGIGIAPDRFSAGLSFAGENVLLTADNQYHNTSFPAPITQSFGTAANFATTAHSTVVTNYFGTDFTGGGVFNVVIKPDGTYLEEVTVTINSPYGLPVPFKGTQKLAAGQTVRVSVDPIVYEDSAGAILNAANAILIRNSAVTRRICTGYTVRNSTINGTASALDYALTGNSEITFLWRTEHALEVKTNLPAGLTSEAAGTPGPEVNKHWIAENSPVIAQIDGAATNLAEPNVRYRSTGYIATGLATPAGGTAGTMFAWPSFQNRQQITQFTLTGPASITWQWQKELSVRVTTLPPSASGGATATSGSYTATGDGEFWFAPGSSVTVTSPPLRDAGRQILLGYSTGVGSVIPAAETAVDGVLSKTFTLNTASSILWNYGKTPIRQRVTIGDAAVWTGMIASVMNTQPTGITVVADAPAGTSGANAIAWEPVGRRILPLRPGKYLLEFNDPAVDVNGTGTEDNVTMEITAGFQGDPVPSIVPAQTFAPAGDAAVYQTYIASSPSVALDPSASDTVAWLNNYTLGNSTVEGLALAGGNAAVNNARFVASEVGSSVLVFSQAAVGKVGRGSLETESLFLRVVRTRLWNDPAVLTSAPAIVGTAIVPPGSHDEAVIGHSGYVLTPRARYNAGLHDNVSLLGPVFPVNTQFAGKDDDKLVVAWFNRDGRVSTNWPSRSVDYTVTWPTVTPRIVIAGRLGSEGLAGTAAGGLAQTQFTPPRYTNLTFMPRMMPPYPATIQMKSTPSSPPRFWMRAGVRSSRCRIR